MNKELLIAGVLGFLAVALGAFGAHALNDKISETMMEIYNKGVLYHLTHSAILLILALNKQTNLRISFYLFLVGIILFSFSLYLYAITGLTFIAFITPFGGLSLLAGWVSVIVLSIKK